MINPFFENKGPFKIKEILTFINADSNKNNSDKYILDVKDLVNATSNDITFFHSKKYEPVASRTKASCCITTKQLSDVLPKNCEVIEVQNVLVTTATVTQMFYPDSVTDNFDNQILNIEKTPYNNSVYHGFSCKI